MIHSRDLSSPGIQCCWYFSVAGISVLLSINNEKIIWKKDGFYDNTFKKCGKNHQFYFEITHETYYKKSVIISLNYQKIVYFILCKYLQQNNSITT
jgi:hypothetical protein